MRLCILGASGLIGGALSRELSGASFDVIPIARRFTPAQKAAFGTAAVECSLVDLDAAALGALLHGADLVVNCIGVLQDTGRGGTEDVHEGFAGRLVAALRAQAAPALLVQVSIPGGPETDETPFARTKRAAEGLIGRSGLAHAILRPGFVIAPVAYGGSALLRGLAATPLDLPEETARRPFAVVHVRDIVRTIAFLAEERQNGRRDVAESFDLMAPGRSTLAETVQAFRAHFGGPRARFAVPDWLMTLGGRAGDLAARLGWTPPLRSTALAELRRGVEGRPERWMAVTGISPLGLEAALGTIAPGVQERWFARLFLLKPLIVACLALFWVLSGAIALFLSYEAARTILLSHGFSPLLSHLVTVASSLMDIGIGVLVAVRRSCRFGLLAGIAVSLFYMAGAAVLTPELWIEPLGALVKTGPAIVLMLVALALLEDR